MADYDRDFQALEIDIRNGVSDAIVLATLGMLGRLITATTPGNPTRWENPKAAPPGYVGGAARGNWQIGIGSPPTVETRRVDASGAGTLDSGKQILSRYDLGPKIYVVNNRPYIRRLNQGHSTAIPRGFVQKSIQGFGRDVAKVQIVR